MPRKLFELKKVLRRTGFRQTRSKGSHSVWTHPEFPGSTVVLCGKDGDDAKPYQEKIVTAITKSREADNE